MYAENKRGNFEVFECKLTYKDGDVFPEGGYYSKTTMDICQKCTNELMTILGDLGYRLNTEKVDV